MRFGLRRAAGGTAGLDYLRAVPTGPLCPLVLAVTRVHDELHLGLAYRTSAFSREAVEALAAALLCQADALRARDRGVNAMAALRRAGPGLALAGCASAPPPERAPVASRPRRTPARRPSSAALTPDPQLEPRILALDPQQVSDRDVRQLLADGPTPRIVSLHGGIYPVHLLMESFSRFLAGMGYPPHKLKHPGDGRLSHSPYENSLQIAGLIAWYYEHEGLMPMMIGHSQGGIQLVEGAARPGRRRRRPDRTSGTRDRCGRAACAHRRPLHRRRAPGGRAEGRLRLGGRLGRRRADAAQPVEHGAAAAHDSRHGGRLHRLRAGGGPGGLGPAGGGRPLPGRRRGARVRNVELPAGVLACLRAARPRTWRATRRCATGSTPTLPGQATATAGRGRCPPRTACGPPTCGSTSRSTGCWRRRRWCARGATWPGAVRPWSRGPRAR